MISTVIAEKKIFEANILRNGRSTRPAFSFIDRDQVDKDTKCAGISSIERSGENAAVTIASEVVFLFP